MPAASTGWAGGVRAQRSVSGVEQAAPAQARVEAALLGQDRGPTLAQQLEEGQRLLPVLGEIARHQLVEPAQIDLLVVQLVEELLQLAGQPHRLLVRHPRAAREHEAGQQQATPDRADRRRQGQLQLGVEQQQGLVGLADRQQAGQQQGLAAAQAQEGIAGGEAGAAASAAAAARPPAARAPSPTARRPACPGTGGPPRWYGRSASRPTLAGFGRRREAGDERRPAAGAVELGISGVRAARRAPAPGRSAAARPARARAPGPATRPAGHLAASTRPARARRPRCRHGSRYRSLWLTSSVGSS